MMTRAPPIAAPMSPTILCMNSCSLSGSRTGWISRVGTGSIAALRLSRPPLLHRIFAAPLSPPDRGERRRNELIDVGQAVPSPAAQQLHGGIALHQVEQHPGRLAARTLKAAV